MAEKTTIDVYLLVRGDPPEYFYVNEMGLFDWTPDIQKALRLSRREDADMLAPAIEDVCDTVEHDFG